MANEQSTPMFRVMTEDRVGIGSAAPTNVTIPYKYNVRVSQIDCTAPVNPFNRAIRGEEESLSTYDYIMAKINREIKMPFSIEC